MTGPLSVRLADPCDWPAAEAMLRAGFGDEDWFLRAFFDFVWQRCDTLLSLQDGVPAAMTALLLAVFLLGVFRAGYIPSGFIYTQF